MVTTASGPAPATAIPVTTPPAQSEAAAVPASAPAPAPSPVADTQPLPPAGPDVGRGGLPTNVEDIDAFFAGEKPLTVPVAATEEGATATPQPVAAPVTEPPVAAPVTETAATVIAPVAQPASAAPIEPDVQRAMNLQTTLNGDRKPGDTGYVKLADAIRQIEERNTPATVIPAGPSPVDLATTAVTTIETDLAALKQQRRELGEDGSFYGPKAVELNENIEAKILELGKAERARERAEDAQQSTAQQQQQTKQQTELAARKGAMDRAAAEFPSAASKDTPLGRRVTALVAQMQDPGHPDHAVLFSTNAAVFVTSEAAKAEAADIAAKSNGAITFAQAFDGLRAKVAPVVEPARVEAEPRRVSPVTGSNGTAAPAQAMTEEQLLNAVLDDPALLDRALYGGRDSAFVIRA